MKTYKIKNIFTIIKRWEGRQRFLKESLYCVNNTTNHYLLIREGYVPINIKFIERKTYYAAFNEFDTKGLTSIMEEIVGRAVTNSYHKRLAYLKGKKIITLNAYAKQNRLSHSNLINKAKRQTIEAFLEKNVWKIGV